MLHIRQQYGKFVSAKARNPACKLRIYMTGRSIAFADPFLYPLGDALEQQVPDSISEGVIYALKSVQIEEKSRNIAAVTLRVSKRLGQVLLE